MPAAHFTDLPDLRILIAGQPRGTIETADWEQLIEGEDFTNWWWITLKRDDGVWVEDSTTVELRASTLEELERLTRACVDALLKIREAGVAFEALRGEIPDIGEDAEDGTTSVQFGEIDQLVSAVLLEQSGMG